MTVDAWAFGPDRSVLGELVVSFMDAISSRLKTVSYSIAYSCVHGLLLVDSDKSRWLELDAAEDFWRERALFLFRLPD